MSTTLDRMDADAAEHDVDPDDPRDTALDSADPGRGSGSPGEADDIANDDEFVPVDLADVIRPLLAAGLSATAAGFVTGGIFGSWAARLLCVGAAWFGVGWVALMRRAPHRASAYQFSLVPVALMVSIVLMIPLGGDPSQLPALVREAIDAGRTLRPPVPFDPGWIPILMVVMSTLAFGAARIGTDGDRQQSAIALPLPLLALTAMTQPDDGQFIAGVGAFVPLVAALAVLFAGDRSKAQNLSREFEAKRAVRGIGLTVVAVLALFALGRANVLFPEPAFDPSDRPQKPKPLPLSEIPDEVLFEIETDSVITGPWRTGVLDDYDGTAWRIPAFDEDRLVAIPSDGVTAPDLLAAADQQFQFTTRGLTNATSLPGTTSPVVVRLSDALSGVQLDPRTGVLRLPEGRAPADATYSITMPPYPSADALRESGAPVGEFSVQLDMPESPAAIREILAAAPPAGFDRLDFVRETLRNVVVAEGGGVPIDISPERVAEIIEGPDHEASPYEIVAAETMLARWAGIPARIGFGFDGLNDEDGVFTVRPRNAAQWLEVYFEGHGWVPLIEAPDQAKSSLDNEETLFDPDTLATDEVAVEVYVPIELENITQLYQRLRAELMAILPWALLLASGYLALPQVIRTHRRQKRRRWAESLGPRAQVAVEYAEFRDMAHDLNVGDPLATPLEYLALVDRDDQHQEFAWLVARVMYGDLAGQADETMARDAEELGAALRRRLNRGQPVQTRVLAVLGKASLRDPYTDEVPNVVLLDPLGRFARWRSAQRIARRQRTLQRRRAGGTGFRLPVPLPTRR